MPPQFATEGEPIAKDVVGSMKSAFKYNIQFQNEIYEMIKALVAKRVPIAESKMHIVTMADISASKNIPEGASHAAIESCFISRCKCKQCKYIKMHATIHAAYTPKELNRRNQALRMAIAERKAKEQEVTNSRNMIFECMHANILPLPTHFRLTHV